VHWAQGWLHLVSIFGFGLLAGWLVVKRGSVWSAWGAHAFANLLPSIIVQFA
jgi:membrane protease YdiL (CAAX protease family)